MSDDAVARWLLVQGIALLAGAALFGLLFPLVGGLLAVLGVEAGPDGIAPWVTMAVAGPCTACFYAPGGFAALYARGRLRADPDRAIGPLLVAGALCAVVCPLGLVPLLVHATRKRGPAS